MLGARDLWRSALFFSNLPAEWTIYLNWRIKSWKSVYNDTSIAQQQRYLKKIYCGWKIPSETNPSGFGDATIELINQLFNHRIKKIIFIPPQKNVLLFISSGNADLNTGHFRIYPNLLRRPIHFFVNANLNAFHFRIHPNLLCIHFFCICWSQYMSH